MKLRGYIFSGDKSLCSGCGACVQACRHNALQMTPDTEGFLYPELDNEKCVECGFCDRICPVVGSNTENVDNNQHCYVATTNNNFYYQDSASIGICTMLSKQILSKGGVVFGCYLDEASWKAYHIAIETMDELDKIRNSKYLQSDTKKTYTVVNDLLTSGKVVLYIGTPCQIAGLKSFLKRSYDNLYTIDIICHGVFSPSLMPLEIKYWENKFGGTIHNFRFRSKRVYKYINGGMVNFDVERNGKTIHYERHASSSPTYRCYAYSGDRMNYNIRPSCFTCNFRSIKRYGDITVGDPWFIPNSSICHPLLKSDNPIRSLYSVNSEKGMHLNNAVNKELLEEEIPVVMAFCQPATKKVDRMVPTKRSELFEKCKTEDYGLLVETLLDCNLDKAQKDFVWKYRKIKVKRMLKRLVLKR